jgi:hypothetical protein
MIDAVAPNHPIPLERSANRGTLGFARDEHAD